MILKERDRSLQHAGLVMALRESSLIVGAALGIFLSKEHFGAPRLAAGTVLMPPAE
ncbi:hypothetical protein [Streptomyces sp. NPDC088557]|uniref:hypothetical protein n=1 Tax=Streptomyces sp. NPDC088557 TaxID=3365867 RepID=UPI00383085BE